MHEDAIHNYDSGESWTGEPLQLEAMTDKAVVCAYWGNGRYMRLTGDKRMEAVPPAVRQRWVGATSIRTAQTDADWAALRTAFETHGWS